MDDHSVGGLGVFRSLDHQCAQTVQEPLQSQSFRVLGPDNLCYARQYWGDPSDIRVDAEFQGALHLMLRLQLLSRRDALRPPMHDAALTRLIRAQAPVRESAPRI